MYCIVSDELSSRKSQWDMNCSAGLQRDVTLGTSLNAKPLNKT